MSLGQFQVQVDFCLFVCLTCYYCFVCHHFICILGIDLVERPEERAQPWTPMTGTSTRELQSNGSRCFGFAASSTIPTIWPVIQTKDSTVTLPNTRPDEEYKTSTWSFLAWRAPSPHLAKLQSKETSSRVQKNQQALRVLRSEWNSWVQTLPWFWTWVRMRRTWQLWQLLVNPRGLNTVTQTLVIYLVLARISETQMHRPWK